MPPDRKGETMSVTELIQEQVMDLPEAQAKEVLDFILFLKAQPERQEWQDLMNAQESGLQAVWDNEEDRVWDAL